MEEKLAKIAVAAIGGSFLVAVIGLILIYGLTIIMSGEVELSDIPLMLKIIIPSALYVYSIYLLGTLPGKSRKQRSFAWVFSIAFHSGLLMYLGVVKGFCGAVFILGLAETIVLVLSLLGISVLLFNFNKSKRNNNKPNHLPTATGTSEDGAH